MLTIGGMNLQNERILKDSQSLLKCSMRRGLKYNGAWYTELMNLSTKEIEQRHFYEERFVDRHNECYYSHVAGITLGVCKCGEYFFAHVDKPFAGEKQVRTEWRSHARGNK